MATKLKDSERKKVTVERRYSEASHKIFASTVIVKDGVKKLEQFKIPVKTEVSLPVEVIAHLKTRKVAKFIDGKQQMAAEYVIDVA